MTCIRATLASPLVPGTWCLPSGTNSVASAGVSVPAPSTFQATILAPADASDLQIDASVFLLQDVHGPESCLFRDLHGANLPSSARH